MSKHQRPLGPAETSYAIGALLTKTPVSQMFERNCGEGAQPAEQAPPSPEKVIEGRLSRKIN
ncbi:hypothetical protein KC926_01680 [Candidatus Kaiserbacteria bacterium]|nr:hypothetical protein [Candidatus Kaiserbacteria bacterium]